MPMNSAVREMFPLKRAIWARRYSRSKISRASRKRQAHELLAPCPAGRRRDQRPDLRGQHVGRDGGVRLAGR